MSFSDRFVKTFRMLLPNPFTIAVLLTAFTFLLALILTKPTTAGIGSYSLELLTHWEDGLWGTNYLEFEVQMMLMLVLGHSLALTRPVSLIIDKALHYCHDTKSAAVWIALFTMSVGFINWGLGLVFGAIFVRKFGEKATAQNIKVNYGLIGAAGYSGMMVWHGGFSGSAPVKVAEEGHLHSLMEGIYTTEQIAGLPVAIPLSETILSPMNITIGLMLICLVPLFFYWMGKQVKTEKINIKSEAPISKSKTEQLIGAEHLDRSRIVAYFFSIVIIFYVSYRLFEGGAADFSVINPNYINLTLLGLAILLHGRFINFLNSINQAITGVSGILIQFPLYFGIMGIMKGSGLVYDFSEFFVSVSSASTYPFFTFLSAGIVNVFVPSGGGQWMVQGPILIQAAEMLNIPLQKCIMALSYGDQLTNMLQPFWALPLLGIAKLSARQIIPYTFALMLLGGLIFIIGLAIF